jgi:hypothetical protein
MAVPKAITFAPDHAEDDDCELLLGAMRIVFFLSMTDKESKATAWRS